MTARRPFRYPSSHASNHGALLCFIKLTWLTLVLYWTFNGCGKCFLNDEWLSCVCNCYSLCYIFEEEVLLTSLDWIDLCCWGCRNSWAWRNAQILRSKSDYISWSCHHADWLVCLWRGLCGRWNDLLKIQSSPSQTNVLGGCFWSSHLCLYSSYALIYTLSRRQTLPNRLSWKHLASYALMDR